ncbi:MAG: leucine-rich repeat domain-containing protein [Corallococcus sp.]|nr:leucine-rich repeat domain-containing protein [Corallococcus sp.]MCM1359581.1 leucine-rich repeat domain-containing protein [Corallococcus sp.]MCM1395173.1 leucine-rich repeat domain-containing protein [Corallococcus sp.]
MSKRTKIIIVSVVCGVAVLGLALGLGLGLGFRPKGEPCAHDSTFVRTTQATCTEDGITETVCEKCGKTVSAQKIDALGHAYGSWKTVVNPTEQKDGTMRRVCSHDGAHAEIKAVPKLSSNDYSLQTVAASCDRAGQKVYSSSQYGTYTVVLSKLKHDYDNAVIKTDNSGESPCDMLYCPECNTKIASTNLDYRLSTDGTYYIVEGRLTGYNDRNLVIPAYHNGKPVKEIGAEAFSSIWWLETVTIPETLTTFGAGAFNMGECMRAPILKTIYFNAVNCDDFNGKNWVFYPYANATTAIELVVGAEVTRIPANMFLPLVTNPDKTVSLDKVTFAENCSVKEIGDYAFYKTKISELTLPSSVEKIGDYACYGTRLKKVEFGDAVSSIGNSAFAACYNLQTVSFGAGLTSVGNDCFNYCGELTSVDMSGAQVKTVGVDAFKNCVKLQTVKLSGTTETVGDCAFENCVALTDCRLGSSLQSLGERAFYGCKNLQSVVLPKPLENLGNGAFEDCVKLSSLQFDAISCNDLAAGNRTFANAGKDATLTVTVGASVTSLPARLFYSSADSDVSVTISKLYLDWNLEKVGANAFLGATVTKAYFNSDASSWNSVLVLAGNDVLNNALAAYFNGVAK